MPSSSGAHAAEDDGGDDDTGDLMPRVDISPLITDALLADLGAAAWGTRKAAADSIDQLLTDAGAPCCDLHRVAGHCMPARLGL